MKSPAHIISIALIGGGMVVFANGSNKLHSNPDVDVPLNVMGLKRSPYGEVVAMAMQGPIDNYWTEVETRQPNIAAEPERRQLKHLKEKELRAIEDYSSWSGGFRFFLENLSDGLEERTNAFAASDAHKFYLRRQIEKKLRFAYELDPAHYGNYNAYHFFLTQPQLGTHAELTSSAAQLAIDTINYCLSREVDPREALTAAAAAGNVLELMLNDRINKEDDSLKYTTGQMRNMLGILDRSLNHFNQLSDQWYERGLWSNLSEMRTIEASDRFRFVQKIRDSQEKAILLLEQGGPAAFEVLKKTTERGFYPTDTPSVITK